jgi:hypothetical protein
VIDAAGLKAVGPSCGLLLSSPLVLLAASCLGAARRDRWPTDARRRVVAAAVQFCASARRLAPPATTSAFRCRSEAWNTDPLPVDLNHERLRNWRDRRFACRRRRRRRPQNSSQWPPVPVMR